MLASSSRNVLKVAQGRIAHAVVDTCSAPALLSFTKCPPRQHRCASTAQAVAKPKLFGQERGEGHRMRQEEYLVLPDHHRPRGAAAKTPLARYNMDLARLVSRKFTRAALLKCKQMKDEGVRPDLTTYAYILEACAIDGHHLEARAAFEDMLLLGLHPTRSMFHHLIHAISHLPTVNMWEMLDSMRRFDITPDEKTYEIIISRYADTDNIELALQYLSEMGSRGLSPTLTTARSIIIAASRMGFPRLALDLAEGFEQGSARHLDGTVWVECLISCSEALFEEGVLRTWRKVVHELNITPDEGCCMQVLHTAGRHGLSGLSLDVMHVLGRIGTTWQEHHFAPVIEALCKDHRIKEALAMLDFIRSHNINPVAETAHPIYKAIVNDADAIDAAWTHLEALRQEGKTIDVTALNVIIQASVALGDLQRAVGTYQASGDLGVTPNTDTYNLLLSGCITAHHRELGDRLLSEMKKSNLKPDVRTYERLVVLCLTQANYEDAFFYLEEMKAEGYTPPLSIYEAIIRKCVQVGDTRYKIAIEEMTEYELPVSLRLQAFIDSGGQHDSVEGRSTQNPASSKRKEWKRRDFLKSADDVAEGIEVLAQSAVAQRDKRPL